jgi:hypothetical protein
MDGIPRASAEQVRVLTEPQDSAACTRMQQVLDQGQRPGGENLLPFEFYQVGALYFALRPLRASTCQPRPGRLCVDLRWNGIHIFDQSLNKIAAIAI